MTSIDQVCDISGISELCSMVIGLVGWSVFWVVVSFNFQGFGVPLRGTGEVVTLMTSEKYNFSFYMQ